MNYVETLGYWYLRMNGFFPLNRFVVHRHGKINYNTDCDLLAVRFPLVHEDIGGQSIDWDDSLFQGFEYNLKKNTGPLVLIVQCKGGRSNNIEKVKEWFNDRNVAYAMKRTGLFSQEQCDRIADKLAGRKADIFDGVCSGVMVGKLLISQTFHCPTELWHQMPVQDVIRFLRVHLSRLQREKRNAWDKFPSDLLQHLIWESPIDK